MKSHAGIKVTPYERGIITRDRGDGMTKQQYRELLKRTGTVELRTVTDASGKVRFFRMDGTPCDCAGKLLSPAGRTFTPTTKPTAATAKTEPITVDQFAAAFRL